MSFILSDILKKKSPEWNTVIWNEEITYQNCELAKVRYKEFPDHDCQGEYLIYENEPFILVRRELKSPLKLWVALHELGHHLLHYPVNHKFSKSIVRRMDREANFFAAIAMIPTFLIEENSIGGLSIDDALLIIAAEFNYPKELIKVRRAIWMEYTI